MSSNLVYSTDGGRMCPACRKPIAACICKALNEAASRTGDGIVRVSREKKGRGGKTVTLVRGLALAPDELAVLGRQLKTACGSGGTVADGVIEIQGDHVERVMPLLQAKGFVVKRAGGYARLSRRHSCGCRRLAVTAMGRWPSMAGLTASALRSVRACA